MKIKVSRYLTDKALDRLDNIMFSNPTLGIKLLSTLYYLVESDQISRPLNDSELKEIAKTIIGERKERKIRRI